MTKGMRWGSALILLFLLVVVLPNLLPGEHYRCAMYRATDSGYDDAMLFDYAFGVEVVWPVTGIIHSYRYTEYQHRTNPVIPGETGLLFGCHDTYEDARYMLDDYYRIGPILIEGCRSPLPGVTPWTAERILSRTSAE